MTGYSDEKMVFVRELEQLAGYDGKEADDDFRTLIGDVQDEFENMKRAAAREGLATDPRLNVQDVLAFGAEVGQDFPDAQKGCEVFASVFFTEKKMGAVNN